MDEKDVLQVADIKQDGSILLGRHTVCDGSNYGRQTAVFTHIHRDHTGLFKQTAQECSQILMTKPTRDMMYALERSMYGIGVSAECYFGRHVRALDYGVQVRPHLHPYFPKRGYGDLITLHPSRHVLGSCQVLVETSDGTRIVYSGDFAADAEPIPCDILVVDSTHGSPMFDAAVDRSSLERRLVEYVDGEIQQGRNILVRAHRGRLHYTMHLLHRALPEQVCFLAHPHDISVAHVYSKYGMDIRPCTSYKGAAGIRIQDGGGPYVEFRTHGHERGPHEKDGRTAVFNLGGRYLGGGTTIRTNGDYSLEFMDHADYGSILDYVRKTGPEWVVTDYARGRQGARLAESIRDIGIRATARPMWDPCVKFDRSE